MVPNDTTVKLLFVTFNLEVFNQTLSIAHSVNQKHIILYITRKPEANLARSALNNQLEEVT